jgi:hypothetical protein
MKTGSIRQRIGREQNLSFLDPLRQPASIFLEEKGSRAKTFAEDAMGFLIASGARNPLFSHLVLRRSEPSLWQNFYQSCLQIENK